MEIQEVTYYAGIGSRQTPRDVWDAMYRIGRRLGDKGYICRTGGADGADTAFEFAARARTLPGGKPSVEVYLPWEGFNGRKGIVIGDDQYLRDIAIEHYPRSWHALREPVKRLMTRNSAQILGRGIGEPISAFVICWTPEGKGGGGTGQAIRVARSYGVPVYDLFKPEDREMVKKICK
jgi:hypothetical protein